MAKLPYTPTKGNLLKLLEEYEFAKEGFKLLDEKKKVLTAEIMKILGEAKEKREKFEKELSNIYELFYKVQIYNGSRNLHMIGLARRNEAVLKILERSFMGVVYPTLKFNVNVSSTHSLINSSSYLDEFLVKGKDFVVLMIDLIEIETRLFRLGNELRKLLKRVNALEYIHLPQYRETIKFIEETLEELDREEFFLRKVLKRKENE
jgi:V/A-type H+-transporting ATPase subunit D